MRGGRCEACPGDGLIKIEMHFLPDIYVPCEVCKGKRYNRETLEVKYRGKNIYEVLDTTVDEALPFLENLPRIYNKLQTLVRRGPLLCEAGPAPPPSPSGGEAQRVKLATELAKRATGRTIYILDEPTTGLHTYDHQAHRGAPAPGGRREPVVVIEHNLDVIKTADYVIDLGPEGGDGGGTIVCTGTPEEVAGVRPATPAST